MAVNVGKVFEGQLKKSIPSYALLYRLPDSAQSFGGSSKLRFSSKNPFDFLIWDSQKHKLYAIEAKTVANKSISFERNKDESKEIHYHQIEGLNKWDEYDGITCGFMIEFRAIETTIFINIKDFNILINAIDKKSFNIDDLDNNNIHYEIISQQKARTRYTYDLDKFLKTTKN